MVTGLYEAQGYVHRQDTAPALKKLNIYELWPNICFQKCLDIEQVSFHCAKEERLCYILFFCFGF